MLLKGDLRTQRALSNNLDVVLASVLDLELGRMNETRGSSQASL